MKAKDLHLTDRNGDVYTISADGCLWRGAVSLGRFEKHDAEKIYFAARRGHQEPGAPTNGRVVLTGAAMSFFTAYAPPGNMHFKIEMPGRSTEHMAACSDDVAEVFSEILVTFLPPSLLKRTPPLKRKTSLEGKARYDDFGIRIPRDAEYGFLSSARPADTYKVDTTEKTVEYTTPAESPFAAALREHRARMANPWRGMRFTNEPEPPEEQAATDQATTDQGRTDPSEVFYEAGGLTIRLSHIAAVHAPEGEYVTKGSVETTSGQVKHIPIAAARWLQQQLAERLSPQAYEGCTAKDA